MKALIQTFPSWLKVSIYFLIMWLATFIAGIFPALNSLFYFFAVSLFASWLLIRTDHSNLSSLGYYPRGRRHWKQLFYGTLFGGVMLVITAVITLATTKADWHFNKLTDPMYMLIAFAMCVCSAYIQEFVFRGYPFQALLKKYKPWVAQLAIAVPFGLMHINHAMQLQDIATVMLTTGLGSVLFGLAYIKTRNLMLPAGIHLGWNYAQVLIPRTSGTYPNALISVTGGQTSYGSSFILTPYFVVVTAAILLLLFMDFDYTRPDKAPQKANVSLQNDLDS
ncbi:CPBP family intramembrane glutamic endopeptidase [Mucilaginibacter sp. L3T2-6]|uniref:CPBP family intramembrane glutamic endopeptidase n=1 Tax=Mucilaginibacter sp. L3T2-6 TaxID=3062491 RepID=UPI002676FF95|nr:type II CAAX endopeptidase family protein [Mucilaginibacter sp. L3T2-6]MDO3643823.1 type II CAAX endopeptidase family protein [Mucilaginibacter sp. L3T2-6]MDV6216274.1 type II CAAX endopeptidase family protein [Mucilaginibacter sp. L3T2-6]